MAPSGPKRAHDDDDYQEPSKKTRTTRKHTTASQTDDQTDLRSKLEQLESAVAEIHRIRYEQNDQCRKIRFLEVQLAAFQSFQEELNDLGLKIEFLESNSAGPGPTPLRKLKATGAGPSPAFELNEVMEQPTGNLLKPKPNGRGKTETFKDVKAERDKFSAALQVLQYQKDESDADLDRVNPAFIIDQLLQFETRFDSWAVSVWRQSDKISDKSKIAKRGKTALERVSGPREADLRKDSKATMNTLIARAIVDILTLDFEGIPAGYQGILEFWRVLEPQVVAEISSTRRKEEIPKAQRILKSLSFAFNVLQQHVPLEAFASAITRRAESLVVDIENVFRVEVSIDMRHVMRTLLESVLEVALKIPRSWSYIKIIHLISRPEDIRFDPLRMKATKDQNGEIESGEVVLGTCFPGLELLNEQTNEMDVKIQARVKLGDNKTTGKKRSKPEASTRAQPPNLRSARKATVVASRANKPEDSRGSEEPGLHGHTASANSRELSDASSRALSGDEVDTPTCQGQRKTIYDDKELCFPPQTASESEYNGKRRRAKVFIDSSNHSSEDYQGSSTNGGGKNSDHGDGSVSKADSRGSAEKPIPIEDIDDVEHMSSVSGTMGSYTPEGELRGGNLAKTDQCIKKDETGDDSASQAIEHLLDEHQVKVELRKSV